MADLDTLARQLLAIKAQVDAALAMIATIREPEAPAIPPIAAPPAHRTFGDGD